MTDRPIIFSGPMVRALLDGRKTMMRRKLWTERADPADGRLKIWVTTSWKHRVPGDRLWVREAWRVSNQHDATKPRDLNPRRMTVLFEAGGSIANQANGEWEPDNNYAPERPSWAGKLRPSIFLPRWASRLTLEVTGVKVERLRDIAEEDAAAEGVGWVSPWGEDGKAMWDGSYRSAFGGLWDSLHGEGSWGKNPLIVALSFTVSHRNIDIREARS